MSGIKDIWHYANTTIHSARKLINERLQPLGLTSAEGNILLSVLNSDRVLMQEDLVDQLEISKPAVSRALVSLERKGLITREKDTLDKRVFRVRLTDRASQIGPQIEAIYEGLFTRASQGVAEEEIEDFIAIFRRVAANLNEKGRL
ncbi:MAG: MarR family transcriptional regulator [Limnochordia bacterium]|nr:MarR family transcriptional regulator [Limnochordia bacterium]